MSAMASQSPVSRLFTQAFIEAQLKENTKAPRHWPLWGEFTGDRWIPRTKAINAENVSFDDVIMMHWAAAFIFRRIIRSHDAYVRRWILGHHRVNHWCAHYQKYTAQRRYDAINFLENLHNRHPIVRPWGPDIGCLLWVQILIYIWPLSSQCCI